MDNMVGFKSVAQEETDKVNPHECPNTPKLPDKEFFKNLGVDSGKRLNVWPACSNYRRSRCLEDFGLWLTYQFTAVVDQQRNINWMITFVIYLY